jgi:hypothetical protein
VAIAGCFRVGKTTEGAGTSRPRVNLARDRETVCHRNVGRDARNLKLSNLPDPAGASLLKVEDCVRAL